jgi:RNA polymerase sigma-70 factor (ECF subfamily)
MDLDTLTDEELIATARQPGSATDAALAVLYRRYYSKVAGWCLRISGDRQEAADLAQEVFLRVHERLGSFRGESRFSTWLYTVTRSVAINRGTAARRRQTDPLDEVGAPEPVEPSPGADEMAEKGQIRGLLPVARDAQAPAGHLRVVPPVEEGEAGVAFSRFPARLLDQLLVGETVQIHNKKDSVERPPKVRPKDIRPRKEGASGGQGEDGGAHRWG